MTEPNGENTVALKALCSFFAGVILAGLGAVIGYPRDLPTKADMVQSEAATDKKLDAMEEQLKYQQEEITSLKINTAKIALKLNISIDDR